MLPLEVVNIIVSFCQLCTRYRCSFLAKTLFPFSTSDWTKYGRQYRIGNATRLSLKSLLDRDYAAQTHISLRLNRFWSQHFRAPLLVWSPWTIKKCCRKQEHKMELFFREYRFVNFVRQLGRVHNVRTPCIRKKWSDDCVATTIWCRSRKRLEMTFYKRKKKRKRFCVETSLKSYERTRALLEFRIVHGQLSLYVQQLEFWS